MVADGWFAQVMLPSMTIGLSPPPPKNAALRLATMSNDLWASLADEPTAQLHDCARQF
jgi:hypothetical protein